MAIRMATFVPVSNEMLEDAALANFSTYLRYILMKRMVAELMNENWTTHGAEMRRVEFGFVPKWDWFPDEDDDDED